MSTPLTRPAAVIRAALTATMLALTATISAGAGWLSFLAVRDLAVLVGWPPDTAWVVQPIVELFLVVGSLEIVCRAWEGRTDLTYPKTLIAAALVVILAANVADHVLRAAAACRPARLLVLVAILAALVPAAQLGSLHLISGRLNALGQRERISPHPTANPTTNLTTPAVPFDRAALVAALNAGDLTAVEAAARAGRTTRTVRRWLAADEQRQPDPRGA